MSHGVKTLPGQVGIPREAANSLPTCTVCHVTGEAGQEPRVSDPRGGALPFARLASCFITPGTGSPELLGQVLSQPCPVLQLRLDSDSLRAGLLQRARLCVYWVLLAMWSLAITKLCC